MGWVVEGRGVLATCSYHSSSTPLIVDIFGERCNQWNKWLLLLRIKQTFPMPLKPQGWNQKHILQAGQEASQTRCGSVTTGPQTHPVHPKDGHALPPPPWLWMSPARPSSSCIFNSNGLGISGGGPESQPSLCPMIGQGAESLCVSGLICHTGPG